MRPGPSSPSWRGRTSSQGSPRPGWITGSEAPFDRRRPDGAAMSDFTSEVRDGMRIDWDVPIVMDDGLALRADVYRPIRGDTHPVIMSYGPYGKWLHFEDLYTDQSRRMTEQHPDVP